MRLTSGPRLGLGLKAEAMLYGVLGPYFKAAACAKYTGQAKDFFVATRRIVLAAIFACSGALLVVPCEIMWPNLKAFVPSVAEAAERPERSRGTPASPRSQAPRLRSPDAARQGRYARGDRSWAGTIELAQYN